MAGLTNEINRISISRNGGTAAKMK